MITKAATRKTETSAKVEAVSRLLPRDIEEGRAAITKMRNGLTGGSLKRTTKDEYAARVERFQREGVAALEGVGKRELAVWKAALKWDASQRVRKAMRVADDAWKGQKITEEMADGTTRVRFVAWHSEGEKWKAWRAAYADVCAKFANFETVAERLATISPERDKAKAKREADHKKRPLRPAQMSKLFDAIPKTSKYRTVFLVASMCGARPEEFAAGVKVEPMRDGKGRTGLKFSIVERAKHDGDKKGLVSGEIFVPFDSLSGGMLERARELAATLKASGGKLTCKVAPSQTRTVGQVLTQAIRPFTKKLPFDCSFYSFRQTFSAAAKSSAAAAGLSPQDAAVMVAEMMGHQSTDTQRFYGRSDRGGGEFSPEAAREPSPEIRAKSRGRPGATNTATQNAQAGAMSRSMQPPTAPPKPRRL